MNCVLNRPAYQRLGFSLKPGRFHAHGLRNNHIKFEDGSGLELISPPGHPTDDLTRRGSEETVGSHRVFLILA